MTFTTREKLDEITREVGMRTSLFTRYVASGRMPQERADRLIGIMRAIAADYQAQADAEALAKCDEEARLNLRAITARLDAIEGRLGPSYVGGGDGGPRTWPPGTRVFEDGKEYIVGSGGHGGEAKRK